MERTVSAHIAGRPFIFTESGFMKMKSYLDQIERSVEPAKASETMQDIESRIAQILESNRVSNIEVVDKTAVQNIIDTIGEAKLFKANNNSEDDSIKRIYRNSDDAIIGGVCSGLADYLKIDKTIVRILAILLIFGAGLSLWLYLFMWILIPRRA